MNDYLNSKRKLKAVIRKTSEFRNRLRVFGKTKIFCIGANKTGTTSLKTAMQELGFKVGNQSKAVSLIDDWAERDFKNLINYCRSAEFFQDIPFSLDYTYQAVDQAFKDSKFILTVRDSPEQWYNSVIRFESKLWGQHGKPPTKYDLQESPHISKGKLWHIKRLIYDTPEDNIYDKQIMIEQYLRHNELARNYFRHRPDDLLVLNISDKLSYIKLCKFLGVKKKREVFPWENRTSEI